MNQEAAELAVKEVVALYAAELNGVEPSHHVKSRPDGDYLIFEFASPGGRFFEILSKVDSALPDDHLFKGKMSVAQRPRKPNNVLVMPETALVQRELSANLTVDRNTFELGFLSRYTPSVTGLEANIVGTANHIVYGRRGSGKSSLLAFAMHQLRNAKLPFCWIAMQTYAGRSDKQAIASILSEICKEASK